ncbi:MAG: cobyric acid synthase [Methanomicrobiales archaeon]|nr:cobyric acid synthase [Methanomicrobiales archaeon]
MSVMVLGTASHVGKSTVVAAICRALADRGIVVAPFKSQNMSLNSFVTEDGGEMGIAQAVQAQAARIPPHVDMNPVLLKPKGEKTSQIVLLGHPYRDLPITEYYQETDHLLAIALEASERLKEKYGHLIVEGAGGAAEVNLYDRDIANIRLADALQLPIILVADIERGGVFAQVYGTLTLLPPGVRRLVKGIIINKFRGDPALFSKGVQILEDLCGVPVLGVLPFTDLHLPSEDSLSIKDKRSSDHQIRIAILRLPHISNFTDFELLEQHASVEYVVPGASLEDYDCIILPGTKNTIEDLLVLRETGSDRDIAVARDQGIPIIGICGGYQILGQEIIDSGIESRKGRYPGLGLLNVVTTFTGYRKNTRQITLTANPIPPILSGIGTVQGYEIHMGETERGDEMRKAFESDGAVSSDGLVIGTYLHGLFRNVSAVNSLLYYLSRRKELSFTFIEDNSCDPFEDCARLLEDHVNMEKFLSIFHQKYSLA